MLRARESAPKNTWISASIDPPEFDHAARNAAWAAAEKHRTWTALFELAEIAYTSDRTEESFDRLVEECHALDL